jgi:putative Mg2+ transporter-C (MgtC) family protein
MTRATQCSGSVWYTHCLIRHQMKDPTMSTVPMLSLSDTVLRLVLATLLGALVGLERERLERERRERAAGLRTHAIVALAAALMMVVSTYGFSDVLGPGQLVQLDVSRVAAQVVTGIGFLGAGIIIFRQSVVRGLTTAASVWAVAGLGLACGGGLFAAAGVTTALLLLLQIVLRPIEQRFFTEPRDYLLALRVQQGAGSLASIESVIRQAGVSIESLRVQPVNGGLEDRIDIALGPLPDTQATKLLDQVRALEGATLITYAMGSQQFGLSAESSPDPDRDEAKLG